MSAPTIEMVAEALKNCSENRGGVPSPLLSPLKNGNEEIALELNSHITLPYYWEQFLDIQTGEIYYTNWLTGIRTTQDPRKYIYSSEEDFSDDSSDDSSGESGGSSAMSSLTTETTEPSNHVLVVAGCKACYMYSMIPKGVEACSKCGGSLLLQFDRL